MSYFNITEVESALIALADAHPGLCELITLPERSFEGRECHAIRLGRHPAHSRDAVLLTGGVHAREWGSCEILVNLAADLLEACSAGTGLAYGDKSYTAEEIKGLMEGLSWVIFPLVNPDGRLHSQTVPNLWRKNRNTTDSGGDPLKIGVDLNRNHDFLWDFRAKFTAAAAGSLISHSDNPRDDSYHGSAPYSESEARNVRWLLDQFPRVRWSIDVHSYGRLIEHNWGDDNNQSTDPSMNFLNPAYDGLRGDPDDAAYAEFISDNDLLDAVAPLGATHDSIEAVRGKNYFTGQSFTIMYMTSGSLHDYVFSRHLVDRTRNKIHGYILEWGEEFQPEWTEMEEIIKEVDAGLIGFALHAACGGWTTNLITESVQFLDVPESQLAARAILFSVHTCHTASFVIETMSLDSGPGILGQLPSSTSRLPATTGVPGAREARLWLAFESSQAGAASTGTVVVRLVETGQTWTIPVTANVVRKPTVAAVLALDQSGSMNQRSGIAAPLDRRADVLRFAAPSFVNLLRRGDGIGIVAFDQDAHDRMNVRAVGAANGAADPARGEALAVIAAHTANSSGTTAIGDGVERAHNLLLSANGFDHKAVVVFTDGFETSRKYISEVSDQLDERVFAIGLGTAEQLQPAALTALTNGSGGFLLLTGALNDDNGFLLNKYFMQVLAGVTNQDIVLDPDGWLAPGVVHRIPFALTDADISVDVILVSQAPPEVFMWHLESPEGDRVEAGTPGVSLITGTGLQYLRMTLPVSAGQRGAHHGLWHAVLAVDPARFAAHLESLRRKKLPAEKVSAHGPRYSLSVQTFSGVRLLARASQDSNEPGARLTLRAVLSEHGIPIEGIRASVRAEIADPDGSAQVVSLQEVASSPGTFECRREMAFHGVSRIRILAEGCTLRGRCFTREHLLTAATWKGGDQPPPRVKPGNDDPRKTCGWLCSLWRRLFALKRRG